MINNEFIYELTVFLKDTNLFGNVYFSRYFEWQGMARETYFQTVNNYKELLSSGIKLITKKASIIYIKECTAFDEIIIKIQNREIKKYSFIIEFTFINKESNELLAKGEQMIGFSNSSGQLITIPQDIVDVITKHIINP